MRILTLLFCLLALSPGFSQKHLLRGVVKLQSSGSQPLANVQISAFGASPVYSNSSGMFEMTFNGKNPGSPVSLLISMEGYELINEKELENCVIRKNPDDLVFIIMAKQGERNKQALAYYNIIVENTNANFKKELNNINKRLNTLDENDSERDVLLQQIEELQKEKDELFSKAETLAKELAIVDLDQASGIAREAYQKFQEGDVKAALTVLDDQTLDENLKEAKKDQSKLQENLLMADSAVALSIENYMIKARFCITDNQYKAAYKNYLKAVEADSTNMKNILELASYCNTLHQQKRAIRFYKQALDLAATPTMKAEVLLRLAVQYTFDDNFTSAEILNNEALKLVQGLETENPLTFQKLKAKTHKQLADMYTEINEFEKAIKAAEVAYNIYTKLIEGGKEQFKPDLANLLRARSSIYFKQYDFNKATEDAIPAIEILKPLAKEDPFYRYNLAYAYMALGSIYAQARKVDLAEPAFLDALQLISDLAADNPEQYQSDLARMQGNLGTMYRVKKSLQQSKSFLSKSLETYTTLAAENPVRYDYHLARTYSNLGGLYYQLNNFEMCEESNWKAIEIRRKLAKKNPKKYNLDLIMSILNQVNLEKTILKKNLDMAPRAEALELINEAKTIIAQCDSTSRLVEIRKENIGIFESYFVSLTPEDLLVQGELNKFEALQRQLGQDSTIELRNSRRKDMSVILENALKTYPKNKNLIAYSAEYYGNLSWEYIHEGQFAAAEQAANQGLEIDSSIEWIKSFLAPALLFQGKFKKAQKIYIAMKDLPNVNGTYKNAFLSDLDKLEQIGITHEDVAKIRELLNEE